MRITYTSRSLVDIVLEVTALHADDFIPPPQIEVWCWSEATRQHEPTQFFHRGERPVKRPYDDDGL